jgi:hypothetical protein
MGFRLFNVFDTKSLLTSDTGFPEAYVLPGLSGEVMEIEFYLLQKTGSVRQPYRRMAPGSYSLAIGLFKQSDNARIAYQNNTGFLDDAAQGRKLGKMSLSTVEIAAIWAGAGSPTDVDVYLAINVETANGGYESFRAETTLYKPLITSLTTVPAAVDVAATQAWTLGNFVRMNSPAGAHRIERDDLGNAYEVFIVNGQYQLVQLQGAPPAFP